MAPMFILATLCSLAVALSSATDTDLITAESVAKDQHQSQSVSARSASARRYGYPYGIAPPLSPTISARSDEDHDMKEQSAKTFVSKVLSSEKPSILKKSVQKKRKIPFRVIGRRQGLSDIEDSVFRNYREPKYRNFDDLEGGFKPRRYDLDDSYEYGYKPKVSRKPMVSPRDPYLSPSDEPSDTFYPTVPKLQSYSGSYGKRIRSNPTYGAGSYEEDTDSYHPDSYDNHKDSPYEGDSYDSHYPTQEPYYGGYEEDYTIESNKPIVGEIRKRLLDHAGASDHYEGEPDYLQQLTRNKSKYGHIGNDYYSHGRPQYDDQYESYPYEESKLRAVKKLRI